MLVTALCQKHPYMHGKEATHVHIYYVEVTLVLIITNWSYYTYMQKNNMYVCV